MKRRNFLKISLPILATNPLIAGEEKAKEPELIFGVIADPQYADVDPKGSRHYRNSIKKLGTAITELNKHELKFTVTLGDVIDRDFKSFAEIMPIYKTAKAPQTYVLGNHDFEVAEEDKEKVMDAIGLEKGYYSQTIGKWVFIYLDGTDVSTYRYPENSQATKDAHAMLNFRKNELKQAQAQPWNGSLGQKQMQWLTDELDTAKHTNKRVIVFNHFPVFPLDDPHNLWNDKSIVGFLKRYPNVVAYMNGHNHKGNYGVHKGCHYVNFKGMVETETSAPFSIIKCYADRIEINGFDPEPDRELEI